MIKEKTYMSNDLIFKETLCNINNRDKLVYFLNLITDIDKKVLTNNLIVKYDSILQNTKLNDKNYRGDIIISFDKYLINLESYSYFNNNSFNKSTSYIMRIFSTQLEQGKNYDCLESVIQINLIDNVRIKFDPNILSEYYITNSKNINDKKLSNKFIIKYYRIDKIKKIPYNELTEEERWIRFLGTSNEEDRKKLSEGDVMLMELNNWIEKFTNDEQTKEYYGKWAEQIAEEKGFEKKAFEIAKTLKEKGYSNKEIQEITNLSIEDIKSI